MLFRHSAYGVAFDSNYELNLPARLKSDLAIEGECEVSIVRLGDLSEPWEESVDCELGAYRRHGQVHFNIPGIVRFVVGANHAVRTKVACWGCPEDLSFFFDRLVCAEILKVLGLNRIFGCLCELNGVKLLFVGPSAVGKTAAAAAVLSLGGIVASDGLAVWRDDKHGPLFDAAGLTLYCWEDLKHAWFDSLRAPMVRGNVKRFAVPVRSGSGSMRGISTIVSLGLTNDPQYRCEEILGTAKLAHLSGYVDKPIEFLSVCPGLRVFDFKRPRVLTASFAAELEAAIFSIVAKHHDGGIG